MIGNPAKKHDPKKAYGVAQYTEKMTLAKFSEHISSHGSTYDAEDVEAILGKSVKCLREMLLAGKKVELGKLGEFYVTLHGKGTELAKDYNPVTCVEKVNVVWDPGKLFENLKEDAAFNSSWQAETSRKRLSEKPRRRRTKMATHRLPREVIAQRKGAVVPRHQTRRRAHSPEVEIHHRAVATENNSY